MPSRVKAKLRRTEETLRAPNFVSESSLSDSTGKTQGMKLSSRPPITAAANIAVRRFLRSGSGALPRTGESVWRKTYLRLASMVISNSFPSASDLSSSGSRRTVARLPSMRTRGRSKASPASLPTNMLNDSIVSGLSTVNVSTCPPVCISFREKEPIFSSDCCCGLRKPDIMRT